MNIFENIYNNKTWGGNHKRRFFSGGGSMKENSHTYVKLVSEFIKTNNIKKVIDIGCGDWLVGELIDWGDSTPIATDIASNVIEENKKIYPHIDFRVLNTFTEELPTADLCLVRQVFQHLSNEDISKLLFRFKKYKYIIVTDGISKNTQLWNKNQDKTTNNKVRVNGLFLESQPFNQTIEILLEHSSSVCNEILRSILIINNKK